MIKTLLTNAIDTSTIHLLPLERKTRFFSFTEAERQPLEIVSRAAHVRGVEVVHALAEEALGLAT